MCNNFGQPITLQRTGVSWHALLFLSRLLVYNEQPNCLHMYERLLTNRLQGEVAELFLANSRKHSVTATKYIECINTIHSTRYSFYHMLVNFTVTS